MAKTVDDYVLEQLERLNNPNLKGEELKEELAKSDAISKLAKVSIEKKEADTKAEELDVKRQVINFQYGKGGNLPALPGAVDNGETDLY